jgi:hypothetical protein
MHMFGFTKLTIEEKAAHEKAKRISALQQLIYSESAIRRESLSKAELYTQELEGLSKDE